ncbi:MAG TPA: SRPBCC family protein [Verrucomicrobiae bacterium]|jgi:hypothetical protein|nr:SRPBCC family protein [Verrucomicrobiae bacterium]
MGEIRKQYFFKASVSKAWDVWTNVEKYPEWVAGVSQSRITSAVLQGPGFSWQEDAVFGVTPVQMDHRIESWEPLKKAVVETSLPLGGKLHRELGFQETAEGAAVDILMRWDLGIAGSFFAPEYVHDVMEKNLELTVSNWKRRAEGGA